MIDHYIKKACTLTELVANTDSLPVYLVKVAKLKQMPGSH